MQCNNLSVDAKNENRLKGGVGSLGAERADQGGHDLLISSRELKSTNPPLSPQYGVPIQYGDKEGMGDKRTGRLSLTRDSTTSTVQWRLGGRPSIALSHLAFFFC